eukprot:SAG25_NODE_33_length_20262_cov_33.203293_8_plen_201_part_00
MLKITQRLQTRAPALDPLCTSTSLGHDGVILQLCAELEVNHSLRTGKQAHQQWGRTHTTSGRAPRPTHPDATRAPSANRERVCMCVPERTCRKHRKKDKPIAAGPTVLRPRLRSNTHPVTFRRRPGRCQADRPRRKDRVARHKSSRTSRCPSARSTLRAPSFGLITASVVSETAHDGRRQFGSDERAPAEAARERRRRSP